MLNTTYKAHDAIVPGTDRIAKSEKEKKTWRRVSGSPDRKDRNLSKLLGKITDEISSEICFILYLVTHKWRSRAH